MKDWRVRRLSVFNTIVCREAASGKLSVWEDLRMFEKIINNTEELNAMAVHLRMSQNFSELQALAAQWLVDRKSVV